MVFISSNTLTLNNYNADISIRSQTVAPWSPSYINIDRKGFTFDWDKDGLHLFKIDKTTGTIIDRRRFVINNVLVSDTIINFLNTFDSTKYLLVCKVFASSGGTTLSVNARNKFKEFGSSYVDSVGSFGWYNTWSMIGYKGFNTLLNKESLSIMLVVVEIKAALLQGYYNFLYPSGTITQTFGPAQTWQNFNWEQEVFPNSSLYFRCVRYKPE